MILKAFKAKSNQKFVEKLLFTRKAQFCTQKITTVGVLFNKSEFVEKQTVIEFLGGLGIKKNNIQFFTFSEDKEDKKNPQDHIFTSKGFGWRGKLSNEALVDFTNTQFDALICYYLSDQDELKQIAAMSKAKFKIGVSNADQRIYDIIISVALQEFSIFKTELKKYLSILKKI